MKTRLHIFFVFGICGLFLFFSRAHSDNTNIVITEIGAYEPNGNEWVEILNRGSDAIDLTGWKFWENNTNHALALKQGNDFILDPGEFAVITQDDKKFLAAYPFVSPTVFDSSWTTLSEEGEDIGLKFGTGVNDFVERFSYIGIDNFSLERRDPNVNDYTENNWIEHVSGNTVGVKNSVFVEPISPEDPIVVREEVPDVVSSSPPMIVAPDIATSTSSTLETPIGVTSTPQEISTSTEDVVPEVVVPLENNTTSAAIVLIHEILVDPNDGEKEWVELVNAGAEEVLLDGYTLCDGSGVIASPTGTIGVGGFFVVELKSSKLNNDGDAVMVKNVNGDVVDALSYGSWNDENISDNAVAPKKGNTLIRKSVQTSDNNAEDFFETTSPTKGTDNIFTEPIVIEQNTNNISQSESQREETNTGGSSSGTSLVSFPSGSLVINELLSDPGIEDEEFVEIFNKTSESIDLSRAKLRDGGGSVTLLEGSIAAHGFFVVEKPKGNLNNTGDEVFLIDPSGTILDSVAYGTWDDGNIADNAPVASDPMSLSRRVDGADTNNDAIDFVATLHITAGEANSIDVPLVEDPVFSVASAKLVINEVLPNPVGDDGVSEFIEIYNPTTSSVSLVGWKLSDKDTHYTIHEKVIAPMGYAVFLRSVTGISLNNTGGDQVQLFDPAGVLINTIGYTQTAQEGQSFGRDDFDNFSWTTTPTAGQKNIVTIDEALDDTHTSGTETVVAIKKETAKSSVTKKASVTAKKAPKKVAGAKIKAGVRVALSQIREQDKGTMITTTGTVAVLPGILGTQYFYIVDNTSGIQIYMSKKDFPELEMGDHLQVTGQVSESYGETRLNVQAKSQIDVLEHGDAPVPQSVELAAVNEVFEGALVQNTAQVTDVKAGYMYIDDGSGEIKVYFKKGSGVTRDDVLLGSTITVTGIVSQAQGGYQILPRGKTDVSLVSSTAERAVSGEVSNHSFKNFKNYITTVLVAAVVFLCGMLIKIKRVKV